MEANRLWDRRAALAALSSMAAAALLPGCAATPVQDAPLVPGRTPRVGDTWQYNVTGGWANVPSQIIAVRCEQVGANTITDRLSVAGTTVGDTRTFSSNWAIVSRPLGSGAGVNEFSPYLTAFGTPPAGQRFNVGMPPAQIGTSWSATGEVAGNETVSTPAGSFDAVRINLTANRPFIRGQMDDVIDPVYVVATAWLAPAAKRLVRFTYQSFGNTNNPLLRQDAMLSALTLT